MLILVIVGSEGLVPELSSIAHMIIIISFKPSVIYWEEGLSALILTVSVNRCNVVRL